jgi:predicted metal-binding membrane protein
LQKIVNKGLILATIGSLIYLSWYYMLYGMTMNMEPVATWSNADIALLFMMWAIMMAGMMLPSALPVILLIDKINQQRLQNGSSYTPTIFFSMGYLIAWAIYSGIITILQTWLHHLELLSPMMDSANSQFSAIILIAAGIYQFTPYKQQCLKLCRSPLSLLTGDWQEGIKGAIRLGLKHGSYCVGCCWFLMAILFVTGVMNLQWILILTLLVLVEKVAPKGDVIGKYLGGLLIIIGVVQLV